MNFPENTVLAVCVGDEEVIGEKQKQSRKLWVVNLQGLNVISFMEEGLCPLLQSDNDKNGVGL